MSRTFKPDAPGFPDPLTWLVRALAILALSLLAPGTLTAQGDTTFTTWLRFPGTPPLELRPPPILRSPWAGGPRQPSAVAVAAWDSSVAVHLDSARAARARASLLRRIYGSRAPGLQDTVRTSDRGLLGLSRRTADLKIDGVTRVELRTERLKNERCSALQFLSPGSGCRGGFRPPRLDTDLNLRAGGVIGQRVHVDVDYDTQRDFTNNNNVRFYYQGLDDEIVRRVEVGSVTFQTPPTRFLTAAIPANNFGVNAQFEIGRFQLQGMVATQKGSSVVQRVYNVGATATEPQDRQVRDLDFESGRFFWVPDPTLLPGYPALDILNLGQVAISPTLLPAGLRVYRSRLATAGTTTPVIGGITAIALGEDPTQRLSSQWELLVANRDYYVDDSGLWFVLAGSLGPADYLAVSYPTAAGGTVGTYPAVDRPPAPGGQPLDTLRLISAPKAGPANSTFRHEMRQIYRVGGQDVDRSTLVVSLAVNRSESPQKAPASTYLAQLGLSTPNDPHILNGAERLFPRTRDPLAAQTIAESFIVFPHLAPFADSSRLSQSEISDSLYRTPQYLLLSEGPPAKFMFQLHYNSVGGGDRSRLDLNALQIDEGSEHLTAGGRVLQRDVDYTIDYALGQVVFLHPNELFASGQTQVAARFEERSLFAVAPTQIYGLTSRISLGDVGGINLMGLYQVEKTAFNRPQLGFEASANLVGGMSTDLHFSPMAVTRFLNSLTSRPATAPSRLDVTGEVAFTKPDPNRSGQAYLEEFEGDNGIQVGLGEAAWSFSSRPQSPAGVTDLFPTFDAADAVALTWQNLVPDNRGGVIELQAADIDPKIQVTASQSTRETILFTSFHADTAGGVVQFNNHSRWSLPRRDNAPRWRSIVTSLSPTGLDLSRNEFFEFWIFQDGSHPADSAGLRLVVDLGSADEDAIAIAPESLLVVAGDTVYRGRRLVGLGRLDSERDPLTGIFDAQVGDTGILNDRPDTLQTVAGPLTGFPLCRRRLSNSVEVFPWGDLSSRCSNGNGTLDAEDLNGDNRLNATGSTEDAFRWVVDLRSNTYFVRNGVQTPDSLGGGGWKLYRIPLRFPEFTQGSPNIRLINNLRITFVAPQDAGQPDIVARFAVARMRFLGAPWARRAGTVLAGIEGSTGLTHGEVVASTVSTENVELGYSSPPGVVAATSQKGSRNLGIQINERSLRVIARGLAVGERGEAYLRFPSGPQNLLRYRELRFWAKGSGDGWEEGDFKAFLKLGSDSRNFYLFTSSVHSDTAQAAWLPELSVDLSTWRALRVQVESRWLQGLPPDSAARVACGGDTVSTSYVACTPDGRYLVNVGNPGVNPPNLAAVQELSAGMIRRGSTTGLDSAEVWIDDIRLVDPVSKVGSAMAVDAHLVASDVADLSVGYVRRDGFFQQIGQDPTYQTTGTLQLATSWRMDRFLPATLGVAVPVTLAYTRSSVSPDLVAGTDLSGDQLQGLRTPMNWVLGYTIGIRRTERGRSWLTRTLLDPLSLNAAFNSGRNRTDLQEATSHAYNLVAGYGATPGRKEIRLGLAGLADKLPGFLKRSDGAEGLRTATLNLAPANVRLSSGLTRTESDLTAFQVPVTRPGDVLLPKIQSLSHLWRNSAGLTWQPLGMLGFSADYASTRDLRHYADSTSLGRLAENSRRALLGMDVGVERDRTLSTSFSLTPRLTSWARPRYLRSSDFVLSRSLTSRAPVRELNDSNAGFILPQTLNNAQSNEYGVALDLDRLVRGLIGGTSRSGQAIRRLRPLDLSDRRVRTSTFDLAAFSPDLGYQLAFGGLDEFRNQRGQHAIATTETRTTTLSEAADLPFGFYLSTSYSRIRSSRFQRFGAIETETEALQREWPAGTLRWSRSMPRGPVVNVSLATTYRRRKGTSSQFDPGGGVSTSATLSRSLSPDLGLTFRNGISLNVNYSDLNQRSQNAGNSTELDQATINGDLNYSLRLPVSISRDRRLARLSAGAQWLTSSSCVRQLGISGCRSFADSRHTEYRAGIDTDFTSTVTGGIRFSYALNEAPSLSQRFSQTILTASLQVSLFAGDYR